MFKLLLVSPDGNDFITDKPRNIKTTIEDVQEFSADLGSKWFFYPFHFIITDTSCNHSRMLKNRILDCNECFNFLKGKTVKTALEFIQSNQDFVGDILNS